MGGYSSTHLKVGDSCYDTSEQYGPTRISDLIFRLSSSLSTIVGIIAIFIALSNENRESAWKIILALVCLSVIKSILDSTKKQRFVWLYGTKVPCPSPKPECDLLYTQKDPNAYKCDDRFKYT